MIQSKSDLKFYLQEDAARNGMDCNYIKYLLRLIFRRENALVYRYLKSLRRCEYHTNNYGVIHKLLAKFYSLKLQK